MFVPVNPPKLDESEPIELAPANALSKSAVFTELPFDELIAVSKLFSVVSCCFCVASNDVTRKPSYSTSFLH